MNQWTFEFIFLVRNEEKMEFSIQILLALVIYIEYIRDTVLKLITSKNWSLSLSNFSKYITTKSITTETSLFEVILFRSDRFSNWTIFEMKFLNAKQGTVPVWPTADEAAIIVWLFIGKIIWDNHSILQKIISLVYTWDF